MFLIDVKIFKDLKNFVFKFNFMVYEVFRYVDVDKVRVISNFYYWKFIIIVFQNDMSIWMIRIVGIFDNQRNFFMVGGKKGFVMKD